MSSYSVILFDLDGTLTDPAEGITASFAYALSRMGMPTADKRTYLPYIGPPLADTFEKAFGFTAQERDAAIRYYREYFSASGIFENRLYDGVACMLEKLRRAGRTLLVATSKPEPFAIRILEHFGISGYFSFVAGSTLSETRAKKSEVIRYALESLGAVPGEQTVMVGDRRYDVEGAREVGIDSVGVLYGYGTREELEHAGVTYLAGCVDELDRLLQGMAARSE